MTPSRKKARRYVESVERDVEYAPFMRLNLIIRKNYSNRKINNNMYLLCTMVLNKVFIKRKRVRKRKKE